MTHISSDHRFTSWNTFQNFTATAVISNGVLTCQSPNTSSSAYGSKRIFLKPGERARIRFIARLISGGGDTAPGCTLEFPAEGSANIVAEVKVESAEWREYSVAFTAPWTAGNGDYLQISLGSFTTRVGEVEFILPTIEIESAIYGAPRRMAQGLIKLDAGVPALHDYFSNYGIRSMTYSSVDMKLTITVDPVPNVASSRLFPLPHVEMTADGPAAIVPKWQSFNAATGTVEVKFLDVTTGAFVDVSAYTPMRVILMIDF